QEPVTVAIGRSLFDSRGGQTQSQPEELSIKDKKALEKAAKKAAAKEKREAKKTVKAAPA
ncbi:hypothetical protein HDV02_005529, partial [Globomyces sp. JEL0801]